MNGRRDRYSHLSSHRLRYGWSHSSPSRAVMARTRRTCEGGDCLSSLRIKRARACSRYQRLDSSFEALLRRIIVIQRVTDALTSFVSKNLSPSETRRPMRLLDVFKRGSTFDSELHRKINEDLREIKHEAYQEIRRRELITGMIIGEKHGTTKEPEHMPDD